MPSLPGGTAASPGPGSGRAGAWEPAPPTPAVGVAALGLRRLAGPAEAEIHGVHASEMDDPTPYLLGGELLLTAGAWQADPAQYVARLVRAGVAALGFGVTPVHERVPEPLVTACAAEGLALVEVEPGTPFTAVARMVWRLMAESRTRELRRVTAAQQALASAASRPDPVPAVLARLAGALAGHTRLGGRTAGRPVPPEVAEALFALSSRVGGRGPATATDAAAGWHLSAYALTRRPAPEPGPAADGPAGPATGAGSEPVLGVAVPVRSAGDHTIASVAAVLLTLLLAERPARTGPEAAALTRLLLGGTPASAAAALGPGPWTVVHAHGGGDPAALAAALGTALADPASGLVRLITDRPPAPPAGWRLGVSAPAGAEGLPAADAQAARALHRAEAAGAPLARHDESGLAGLVAPLEARAYAHAVLEPLDGVLRETLGAWLAHHGSWDRTATTLGVHRNTVRQRIARTAALLGRDLDDADVRMELWFALRQCRT
ncbi:PucR family transcriptional regulator [Streptomyces sp. NPDC090131]|uniref:PucR family transcriptional regulator n=1 Tax=Streptomyces sp. NPDC090131 TaxID=3365954 RepID=UPI00382ED276